MRQTYHLCLSSAEEVLFRSQDDFNYGFNCLACAILETESRLLGDGFMTTHFHSGLQSDNCNQVINIQRNAYSRHFNAKYHRKGSLGEKKPFILPVEGLRHIIAMLSYVIRQPLHHGISETPFDYPNSSANSIFRKELGKGEPLLLPENQKYKFIPRSARNQDLQNYRMSNEGVFVREDIIDTDYVEELFISPRSYLYNMNRLSDNSWQLEQMEDKNGSVPIELSMIEPKYFNMDKMLKSESGRIDRRWMGDLELCRIIDNIILPKYFNNNMISIYQLERNERERIGNMIWSMMKNGTLIDHNSGTAKYVSKEQIIRCAAIKY